MTDDGRDFWIFCAHCGSTLDLDDWPPLVELVRGADDSVIHSFCSDECKTAWNRSE